MFFIMAKYSEFRNFMYEGGCSEDFLRCCDYVNCCDSMGGYLLYVGISSGGDRGFDYYYNGWIKERYYGDKYFENLVGKMVYEEGFKGSKYRSDFKGCCKYFYDRLSEWFYRFRDLWCEDKVSV